MTRSDPAQDRYVLALLLLFLVLLVAGLTGAPQVFAYGLAALLGVVAGRGLGRRGVGATWVVVALFVAAVFGAMTGLFRYQSVVVRDVGDTVLGFHPATAILVYGLWIPAFITLGVGFAVLFDRLDHERERREVTR